MNNRDDKTESMIDLICSILALVFVLTCIALHCQWASWDSEDLAKQQAAQLDAEGGAK